eukprot:COSAG06_NODE_811_length_12162_cov_78.059935_15_plen_147_part_00
MHTRVRIGLRSCHDNETARADAGVRCAVRCVQGFGTVLVVTSWLLGRRVRLACTQQRSRLPQSRIVVVISPTPVGVAPGSGASALLTPPKMHIKWLILGWFSVKTRQISAPRPFVMEYSPASFKQPISVHVSVLILSWQNQLIVVE